MLKAPAKNSLAVSLALLPESERLNYLESLKPAQAAALLYDWQFWARPDQLPPAEPWTTWLLSAGRGFGKTRTGAEFVRSKIENGDWRRVALVGRTTADTRDVMVEGEAGLLAVSPGWFRPIYKPAIRRMVWPNGAIATTYSADQPNLLRGPSHDGAWCDELAAWRYPEAWDNLQLGLRLGDNPQAVVTTTPKVTKLYKAVLADPATAKTGGSTYDNLGNLARSFINTIIRKYEGTRLGRQELLAQLLEDNPGALWTRVLVEKSRITKVPELRRIVVAIDPEGVSTQDSAETGIIAAGVGMCACKGIEELHGFLLEDATLRATPLKWANQAIALFRKYQGDRIVAETNNGGEMVETTLRTIDARIPYRAIHASRGKQARAEPVASLYEQGKVHHVGTFAELEDQLCDWVPGEGLPSPDRMDAMVWAFTELMLSGQTWVRGAGR